MPDQKQELKLEWPNVFLSVYNGDIIRERSQTGFVTLNVILMTPFMLRP